MSHITYGWVDESHIIMNLILQQSLDLIRYGVPAVSRLLKIIGVLYRI